MHEYVERVVDLTAPEANQIYNLSVEEAKELIFRQPEAARQIQGSFALVARRGKTVKMARSLDRPMRYFLAKRAEGPALVVAGELDQLVSPVLARATAAAIPGARFELIQGVGHMLPLEAPPLISELLQEFIELRTRS